MKNKKLIALICCVLILVGAAGATLAWLTDQTQTVTNTFTASDINIELTETDADEDGKANDNSYKMVPGDTIAKDPKVTVKAGSEDCWLFITVEANPTADTYLDYAIDPNNWTYLTTEDGVKVYYCTATDVTADRDIKVLGYTDANKAFHPNEVLVKDTVTKEMMEAIDGIVVEDQEKSKDEEIAARPKLVFTAYAVQLANISDVNNAWAQAKTLKPDGNGSNN